MRRFSQIAEEHRQVLTASEEILDSGFSEAVSICANALGAGKKLLVCGNGGSAADAQHFSCECTVRFEKERSSLGAIALTTDTSALTAISNDRGFEYVFARQVESLGSKGDVLIAISTSGRSRNVIRAVETAKRLGLQVAALTGEQRTELHDLADITLPVASTRCARVQEIHGIFLHALAEALEAECTGAAGAR